jgi:hypothetical protein
LIGGHSDSALRRVARLGDLAAERSTFRLNKAAIEGLEQYIVEADEGKQRLALMLVLVSEWISRSLEEEIERWRLAGATYLR